MAQATSPFILGVPAEPLRVYSLGGELLLEKTPAALETVGDLILELSGQLKVAPYRLQLQLLQGGREPAGAGMEPTRALQELSELQLLVAPVDPSRAVTRPGRIVSVRRAEQRLLEVAFEPGGAWERLDEDVRVLHTLRVRGEPHFDYEKAIDVIDADAERGKAVLDFAEGKVLPAAFRELLLHFSTMRLVTRVQRGERFAGLAESPAKPCNAAGLQGLGRMSFALIGHWLIDCLSIASGISALVLAMLWQFYLEAALFAATLWLPGFVWTWRSHCYCFRRKFVGPGSFVVPPLCLIVWCCGVVWLWVPLALIPAVFVFVAFHTYWLLRLLLQVAGVCLIIPEACQFPIQRQAFAFYELYMRDTRIWGDSLRLVLCLVLVADAGLEERLPRTNPLALGVTVGSSLLALVLSCLPYRRHLAEDAWEIFDDEIMELEED
ncbi:unnamed protein product [Effrenium voratum]|uniref:Uncharacterized protein n=1 Tax=Effrenium voratum TaxID=2562239 RepID=A0AA36MRC9_9DINO|nr:unnamed protein product [Effrenium voratum]